MTTRSNKRKKQPSSRPTGWHAAGHVVPIRLTAKQQAYCRAAVGAQPAHVPAGEPDQHGHLLDAAQRHQTRPDITGYDVQYRKSSESAWTPGPQVITETSAMLTQLDPSTRYYVQVRAKNDEGDSLWTSTPGETPWEY